MDGLQAASAWPGEEANRNVCQVKECPKQIKHPCVAHEKIIWLRKSSPLTCACEDAQKGNSDELHVGAAGSPGNLPVQDDDDDDECTKE